MTEQLKHTLVYFGRWTPRLDLEMVLCVNTDSVVFWLPEATRTRLFSSVSMGAGGGGSQEGRERRSAACACPSTSAL